MTAAQQKIWEPAQAADLRLSAMQKAAATEHSGQADTALLFNHMGMTLSAQKGARVTQATIEHAIAARSLPADIMAKWEKVKAGGFLDPEQKRQMVKLAVEMRREQWIKARRAAAASGLGGEPEGHPDLPAVDTGGGATAAPAAGGTAAPGGGTQKMVGREVVEAYAKKFGMSYEAAAAKAKADGFTVKER